MATKIKKNSPLPILILAIVIVLAIVGYKNVYTKTLTSQASVDIAGWKTYTNTKYHYSIEYPGDWTFREFPDTQTGAGFRPANKPNDLNHEYISIDFSKRALEPQKIPFEEYVKKAAIEDIQNYQSLASINKIVTKTGMIGYQTTWNVQSMGAPIGKTHISTPITYFDTKDVNGDTIHVYGKANYLDIYNQMLLTFKLTK